MINKKITPHTEADKESRFSGESVMQELIPLIKSYFVGCFSQRGNKINLGFFNGQNFVLSIEEN